MANANGWGDGASNNNIGWGKGADNAIGWGSVYSVSEAGATDIIGTPAVDPDAQAFITAAAITDPTQQGAINTLVLALKGYNIWTKFKAIYPIVGGSASSHAVNLKTPGTFNLSYANGVNHSSTGMVSNLTSGYANTGIKPNPDLINNSSHISFYSRTNVNGSYWDMGVANDATSYLSMNIRVTDLYRPFAQDISVNTAANTDSRGLYISNRTASNAKSGFKNNTKVVTSTAASSTRAINDIYLLAVWYLGNPSFYTPRECSFATVGDGLTDTEAANFYTAVQAYQTTLSRQV
jgi:hypothetical protein